MAETIYLVEEKCCNEKRIVALYRDEQKAKTHADILGKNKDHIPIGSVRKFSIHD